MKSSVGPWFHRRCEIMRTNGRAAMIAKDTFRLRFAPINTSMQGHNK
jgi:hypothetical protein